MLFQFHPSSIFSSFKFYSSYFYYYLFCLKLFFKLLLFTISPFFYFFSYQILSSFFWLPIFCFGKFFKLIFLNWFVIHFLIESGSSVSQVAGFKNLTKFRMFSLVHSVFFPLSKSYFFLISSFSNYSIEDWVFFLACFLWNFLLVLKMTRLSRIFLWNFLFFIIYFNFIIQYLMYWKLIFLLFFLPFQVVFFSVFFSMRLSQSYVYCHGIYELTWFNYFLLLFFLILPSNIGFFYTSDELMSGSFYSFFHCCFFVNLFFVCFFYSYYLNYQLIQWLVSQIYLFF